jgi:hypothetical protein
MSRRVGLRASLEIFFISKVLVSVKIKGVTATVQNTGLDAFVRLSGRHWPLC